MKQDSIRKTGLLLLIVVTSVAPACFIRLNEVTALLNLLKLLAKIGSLCGTVLLF